MSQLSSDQVEQFREEGYLFLPGYVDDDRVEAMRDETDRILELLVNSSIANDRKSGRLMITENDRGTQTIRQVNPSIDLSRLFKDFARNELRDLVRPLMDSEPISIDRTAQLNYKQPLAERIQDIQASRSSDRYPIHSDWEYYEGRFPAGIVTGIVFLDENEPESGPLEVWPSSHTERHEHEVIDGLGRQIPESEIDRDAGRQVTGPAGSVLVFDCRLVHSSSRNTSGRPRRLAIFGHAPEENVETDVADGSARPESDETYPDELIESTYEHEYLRIKRRNEFEDVFDAPPMSVYPL
jgi:ectoine hydroxylase